jgi:hypothetical protein
MAAKKLMRKNCAWMAKIKLHGFVASILKAIPTNSACGDSAKVR